MVAAILISAILDSAILDSAILVFPFKLTHTCQDWLPPFPHKNFTHSFWLNLIIAAILNSLMLDSDTVIFDSDTLLSSLRFTQKHSHSTLTLTHTNSIWLKLFQTHSHLPRLVPTICTKKISVIISNSTWWWQPSWILPCWIQTLSSLIHTPCYLLSDSLKNTLTQTNSIWLKLIHSHLTGWWQPSWILPCWIQTLPSWIQTPCYLLSDSLKNTLTPLWLCLILIQSDSNSFIFTWSDHGGHLEFGHLVFCHLSIFFQTHSRLPRVVPTIFTKHFTHSFWVNLMMAAILNSDHVGLRHCHLGFRHLVIFSQIYSKTLSLDSDSYSN